MSSSRLTNSKILHFMCIIFLTNISTVQASGAFPAQISQPGRLVQTFLRQPVDQTAKQGDHVTLPCQVENKRGMLQWTRDGFGLGVERNLTGFDRYHMTGSNEEGDYTLDINPVLLEDDADFQCQVGATREVSAIRSLDAHLTVTVPPEPPIIYNGKQITTVETRTVEIRCASRGGKPVAEITWLDENGQVIGDDDIPSSHGKVTSVVEPVENTKRQTRISTLRFVAKKTDHNTKRTCQAQNLADKEPKSVDVQIYVDYAPHVTIDNDINPIQEGNSITFTCEAHANPPNLQYRWFLDGRRIQGAHTKQYHIERINHTYNDKILKCEVSNSIGKTEDTETLNVHYAPKWVVKPQDFSGERKQNATLMCKIDGNPPPTYTWTKNGDIHTVLASKSEYVVQISEMSIGRYTCRARVQGFTDVSTSVEVFMKGPPRITRTKRIQFGRIGDNVEITCDTFSIPQPNHIEWRQYDQNYPIPLPSSHYRIMNKRRPDGMQSKLVILESIASDYGNYNCSVVNTHGKDSLMITLKPEKSLPLIIVLSAVIGGIILTVAAIVIMILCRRSSSISLKNLKNRDSGASRGPQRGQNEYNGGNGSNVGNPTNNKAGIKFKRNNDNPESADGLNLNGDSPFLKSNGNGFDLGSNHPLISNEDGPHDMNEQNQQTLRLAPDHWNGREGDDSIIDNQPFNRANGGDYHEFSENQDMMEFGDNYMAYLPNTNGGNYGVSYQRQDNRGLHPVNGQSALMNADQAMHNGEYFRPGDRSGLNTSDPRFAAKYGNPYLRDPRNSDVNGVRRGMIAPGNELDGVQGVSPVQSPHRAPNPMGGGGRQYATLNTRNGRPYSPNSSAVYRNNHGYGTMQQKGAKNGIRDKSGVTNPGGSLLSGVLTENAKMVGNSTLHSATNAASMANKYIGTMLGNGAINRPANDNATYSSINNKPTAPLSQKVGKSNPKGGPIPTNMSNDAATNGRMAEFETNGGDVRQNVKRGSSDSHYILSPNSDSANQASLATHV